MIQQRLSISASKQHVTAIYLILVSSLFVAISAMLGKWLTLSFALPFLIFFRFFIPMILLWTSALATPSMHLDTQHWRSHTIRAVFAVLCQYAFFDYLLSSSMLNATLLLLTSPLFLPLIERVLYKRHLSTAHWLSLLVGFIGVALILKPTSMLGDWHALIGLSAGFFSACSQIIFHQQTRHTRAQAITLSMYSYSTVLALLPLVFLSPFLSWTQLLNGLSHPKYLIVMLFLAIGAVVSQLVRGLSFSRVKKAVSVMPFMYVTVIFSGVLDWLVFGITPTALACFGGLLIVFSGILIITKKKLPQAA